MFPPLLAWYLGFTIVVLPPIIAAFCMQYHYCPKRRRRQRQERIQKLRSELEMSKQTLKWYFDREILLISDREMQVREKDAKELAQERAEINRKDREKYQPILSIN